MNTPQLFLTKEIERIKKIIAKTLLKRDYEELSDSSSEGENGYVWQLNRS